MRGVKRQRLRKRRANAPSAASRVERRAVFVSDADQKVYKIAGNVKVTDHLQHKVQINGDVKGDTITIKEIKKAD